MTPFLFFLRFCSFFLFFISFYLLRRTLLEYDLKKRKKEKIYIQKFDSPYEYQSVATVVSGPIKKKKKVQEEKRTRMFPYINSPRTFHFIATVLKKRRSSLSLTFFPFRFLLSEYDTIFYFTPSFAS